jgi:hypothetical protein
MSKATIQVLEITRKQESAEVEVKFCVTEDCGIPITNFSRRFSIPINALTSERDISVAALNAAKDVLDKE